jgi:hypothetical protein
LERQDVILDYRIGKQVLANGLKLCSRCRNIIAFEFQLNALADVGLFDGGNAEMLDGAANGVTLGIENAFARTDNDLSSNHDSPYRLRPNWKTFLVLGD